MTELNVPPYLNLETLGFALDMKEYILARQIETLHHGELPDLRILSYCFQSFASAAAYCENHGLEKATLIAHPSKDYLQLALDCHLCAIETLFISGNIEEEKVMIDFKLGTQKFRLRVTERSFDTFAQNWINTWLLGHLLDNEQAVDDIFNLDNSFIENYREYHFNGVEEQLLYMQFLRDFYLDPQNCGTLLHKVNSINENLRDPVRKLALLNEILPVMHLCLDLLYKQETMIEEHFLQAVKANLGWLEIKYANEETILQNDLINFDLSALYHMARKRNLPPNFCSNYLVDYKK